MMVLDTNVLSELMRSAPAPSVVAWIRAQRRSALFTTAITKAELLLGVELLPAGKRKTELHKAVTGLLEEDLAHRVLPFGSEAAGIFSALVARRKVIGRPIGTSDAQIAAIALNVGASVATRDTGGFEHCGLKVVNPWAGSSAT